MNTLSGRKLALICLIQLLAACGAKDLPTADLQDEQHSEEINWFSGSVEDAFQQAASTDTPLYLYWGAIWCPPCEEIKQTVFKDPAFLAKSKLFIPVYLDGDTGRAQSWGERFAVQGYPTMIIFNPRGEEVTRIPGAIEVSRYNQVLELALNGLQKTSTLLEKALSTPGDLSKDDFTQLAYYSWDQQNLPSDLQVEPRTLQSLSQAAAQVDNEIAAARLFLQSLVMRIEAEQPFSKVEQKAAQQQLAELLADPELVLANFDFSMFWSEEIVRLITQPGAEREALSQQWGKRMASLRDHPRLSRAEQLASWYPQLHLYWLNNPEAESLPPAMLTAVSAHVAEMDRKTRGSARQTAINKAYQVLQAAGLYDESRQILLKEVETSASPYYFMSGLASLAEDQGNTGEAVQWLQRAYQAAEGQATRFQWGVEYVTGLIRLQPENGAAISASLLSLLDNLEEDQDVFTGRNFGRLKTLDASLQSWDSGQGHAEALGQFNTRLRQACESAEPETLAHRNCTSLDYSPRA